MREGSMQIIEDDRRLTDKAYILWEHRHGIVTPSAHQSMLLKRKDQVYDYQAHDPRRVFGGVPSI